MDDFEQQVERWKQECLVGLTGQTHETMHAARCLENASQWAEAAVAWYNTWDKGAGREFCLEQSEICLHIARANAKGDEYRATLAQMISDTPEVVCTGCGHIPYGIYQEAHQRVYGR